MKAEELARAIAGKDSRMVVVESLRVFGADRIVLASSLSGEDQVLTHLLCAATAAPRIFTLDTGRLFEETYATIEKTMERYGFRYEILAPDARELEEMVRAQGPNLFYRSVDCRRLCCSVRKTHPLKRVLSSADAWICGLRKDQAPTRTNVEPVEWDEGNCLVKINPLHNWSEADVWDFVKQRGIPGNPLQDRGFRSIGCAPCTRAIGPDDDVRAGRWWWEEPEHKECGLHGGLSRISTHLLS